MSVVPLTGLCMGHIVSCKGNTFYNGNEPIIEEFPNRNHLSFGLHDQMKFWPNYVRGITETRKLITEQRSAVCHRSDCWE